MTSENMSQETATSQTSEATTTSASPASTTTQQTSSAPSGVSEGLHSAADASAPPAMPAYTPNYKFKAYEKEYEVDELFRPLIKDADTEAKIKALHSKAYALDPMKEKLEGTRKEYEGFKGSSEPKLRAYDTFNKIIENKDWMTFFKKLNVPKEEIYSLTEQMLALDAASPEQRAEYERNMAMRQNAYYLEEQNRQYEQQFQQQAVQTRFMQLDSLMARPEVQKYAGAWDERAGNLGAFRQLVVDEAAAAFHATGQDWPVEQAVQHVLNKYGKVIASLGGQSAQPFGQQPTQAFGGPQQAAQQAPPVIPHVAGRGTSPIKKVPKSLDDIKKMVSELPVD